MSLRDFYKNKFQKFRSINFWCDMIIYFCLFSIIGHLLEFPYCLFNSYFFDIVADDSGVWGYPFEPFFVYGITVVFIIIFIVPVYEYLKTKINNTFFLLLVTFMGCVIVSLVFELGMGLIFNQPVNGDYPMWDNSYLPGNILGQAWIVNDVLLGVVAVIFLWVIYPFIQKCLDKIQKQKKIVITLIIVALFCINIFITYGIFHE